MHHFKQYLDAFQVVLLLPDNRTRPHNSGPSNCFTGWELIVLKESNDRKNVPWLTERKPFAMNLEYEGHSEIIDTPLSLTKAKDLFIYLRFNYSKVFTLGVESFFRPFEPRPEEEKTSTFERNLNVALTPSSTSLRVRTAIPCVLSLNFENRGEQQVDRWLS